MKINTALILCAGFGERLKPLTLNTPKPLLKINNIPVLETCINTIVKLGIKKVLINTFYLKKQIFDFIQSSNFPIEIKVLDDGKEILNTGGGILNMINNSKDDNFIIFNPDTLWSENYVKEIKKMENFYFSKKLDNLLLSVNKKLSFDKNFKGDFTLKNFSLDNKDNDKDFIYIGCQILNKSLFKDYKLKNFSISEIWDDLLKKNKLNGFESFEKFYHLTNLDIFKKLKDS